MGFDATALNKYTDLEAVNHVHHAGNSSGIVDGASLMLIGSAEAGAAQGMKPRARIRACAVVGSDPTIMLTGTTAACQKALKKAGMTIQDIAKAFDFVRQIKKTPIVVNDGRGFFTSRVFTRYIAEGGLMLKEGQHPKRVDMAAVKSGMPIGPLVVLDEVSLSTPLSIIEQNQKDLGDAYEASGVEEVLTTMVRELDRAGKKDKKGFYDYDEKGGKKLWPGLAEHFPLGEQISEQDIQDRLLFTQVLESVRAYEEGIVTTVADANIGSIFAVGFAPQHGGVLQFINAHGVKAFKARANELAAAYGERFIPPALLNTMAEANQTFA